VRGQLESIDDRLRVGVHRIRSVSGCLRCRRLAASAI
jgi:hypothetical protein